MITSTEDGLDIICTRIETISFEEADEVWYLNGRVTSSNTVENSNLIEVFSGELAFRFIACPLALHLFVKDL